MKKILGFAIYTAILATVVTACNKVGSLPYYSNGTASVLSASSTAIAPAPADSLKTVVTFSWTNPNYSNDSTTTKYILEIDSSGRNFAKETTKIIIGSLSTSLTAKDLNTILLSYGFAFGVAYDVDVRITSSYGNNNEQLKSNTIKMKMTPYKIPPKVVPPASGRLFIVGSATVGGWSNPVPTPSQELMKIDSVTYGGVFDLTGGQEYLILPVNGDWSHKYSVADKTVSGLSSGGSFGADLSDNIPSPATTGRYSIVLNFQTGIFTVKPYTQVLPTALFIVGDATPGAWNNPVPVPSQQFTQVNSCQYSLTLALTGGKQYLLLPVNGDWSHKFSVADNTIAGLSAGGSFGYDLSSNFPGPDVSGNYKIDVDFLNYKFKLTKQ